MHDQESEAGAQTAVGDEQTSVGDGRTSAGYGGVQHPVAVTTSRRDGAGEGHRNGTETSSCMSPSPSARKGEGSSARHHDTADQVLWGSYGHACWPLRLFILAPHSLRRVTAWAHARLPDHPAAVCPDMTVLPRRRCAWAH